MREWKPSGGVRRSRAAGRRGASSSPSAFRTSTQEPKTPQASLGFPRHARITRGAELQRIMQEGKRFRTKYLEVRAIASPLASPAGALASTPAGTRTRVGLIVPRFRQSAVDRNRLKRRLRELARTRLLPSAVAVDTVIRVRPEAYRASFSDLVANVQRAIEELQHWRATVVEPERPVSEVITPAERQDT